MGCIATLSGLPVHSYWALPVSPTGAVPLNFGIGWLWSPEAGGGDFFGDRQSWSGRQAVQNFITRFEETLDCRRLGT
jgi:hypothetical protein